MKKIVYIVSDIEKALAFEWVSRALKSQFDLAFILIGEQESPLMRFLEDNNIRCYHVKGAGLVVSQWWKVFTILKTERPSLVHTHLWKANLLGLSSAWVLRIPKRIFTRHHAMIHHNEYPSGLKWDKLCNWLATDIVAISENIKKILIKYDKVDNSKIRTIHHGFDLNYFGNIERSRIETVRRKYGISDQYFPVIGVIARYTEWKGIQFTIEAFKQLRINFPHAHLILANADGDYKKTVRSMLSELPKESFTEIVFEDDLGALYKLFNVYVHVPIDASVEAFGQTYVEALASGIPSVFTLSGVAKEFIVHTKNALVVEYKNAFLINESVQKILSDDSLANSLVEEGKLSAKKFSFQSMLTKLETLYG